MSNIDILVPDFPESIIHSIVSSWHKKPGDEVKRDEVLVEIETDKVVIEVPAPIDGILETVLIKEGANVTSQQILGHLVIIDSKNHKEKPHTALLSKETATHNSTFSKKKEEEVMILSTNHWLSKMESENHSNISCTTRQELGKNSEKDSLRQSHLSQISQNRVPMSCLRKRVDKEIERGC